MAITLDATTDGGNNQGTGFSFLAVGHTMGTGTNAILFVVVVGDLTNGGVDDIASVIVNGSIPMTFVGKITNTTTDRFLYLYVLVGPPTGAGIGIVITASTLHYLGAGVASYFGVRQSGQPDQVTTAISSDAQHVTGSLTPVADNCWTFGVGGGYSSNSPMSAGLAGDTVRVFDGIFGAWTVADSNRAMPAGISASMELHFPSTTTSTPPGIEPSMILVTMAPFVPPSAGVVFGWEGSYPAGVFLE